MKTILKVLQDVDNLESVKGGDIARADGPKAKKSLQNVRTKYAKLKLVRGLGGNLFHLVQEGKYAVINRCPTKGCNRATLTRTQDIFQTKGRCSQCRAKKGGK